jgi:hypothetical protein
MECSAGFSSGAFISRALRARFASLQPAAGLTGYTR